MKYDKYFEAAKANGIEQYEVKMVKQATPLKFEIFRGEIGSYTSSDVTTIMARGIKNGKFGQASSESIDRNTANFLAEQVAGNSEVIDSDDYAEIFAGSEKYKKFSTFNKQLETVSADEKIAFAKNVEKLIKELDPRVTEIEMQYSETVVEQEIVNSKGLKLKQKINYFVYYASVVVKEGEETKNGFVIRFGNDYSTLDADEIAKEAVGDAVNQLGGAPVASKKYKCVLDRDVVADFLMFYSTAVNAELVQKNSSALAGKLNEKVASTKVTLEEKPLSKNCLGRFFDDEGVACYNKTIIDKGVLKTYLYNLATAHKDGVTTTGNGYQGAGGKMGVSTCNLVLKQGRLSKDDLFAKVNNGLYITEVAGLHSGLNSVSGDFSLQASGYEIVDGKIANPVTLITVAGNLYEMFNEVQLVGSDSKLSHTSITCPSVVVKKLAVAGK